MSKKINSSCARIRGGGYAFDGYNGTIGDTQSSLGVNCGISTGRNGVLLITEKAYAIDAAITTGGNSTAQGKCWYDDVSPSLKAGGYTE